ALPSWFSSQSIAWSAIFGSSTIPSPGAPFGEGQVPPEKPYCSRSQESSLTCHLPYQYVSYPCSRSRVPQVGNRGSSGGQIGAASVTGEADGVAVAAPSPSPPCRVSALLPCVRTNPVWCEYSPVK